MTFSILLFGAFLLFSAFFSAAETAIFSLSSMRLRRMKERYLRAKTLDRLFKRPTHLLSTIVFGNMLVNIGLSSFATVVFVRALGEKGLIYAVFLSGLLILFFGEIFPKTLAIYLAERLALFSSPLLDVFSRVFAPLIFVIRAVVDKFSLLILPVGKKNVYGEGELKTALLLGKNEGHITAAEEEMISYVLEFKDTRVSEILTARVDIQGIDIEMTQEGTVKFLKEKQHSKFPVYHKSLDNIAGILYAKDVFLNPEKDYRQLLRETIVVPESKHIDDLLKLFRDKNERIAVVLDEYGGTQGIVTLEDIQEEIFGEIYDEFEAPRKLIEKVKEGEFRIWGKTSIKAVNIELNLDLPDDEDTIAGFLLSQMEKIPKPGEKFVFTAQKNASRRGKKAEFLVERSTVKRIVTVRVRI